MYISEKLGLTIEGHKDIDFVDININTDVALYIDPTLIDGLPTSWCKETKEILLNFFGNAFECCKTKNYSRLYKLVAFGREPNETKLGLSIEKSQGKGTGSDHLYTIFKSVADQCLIEKGLIELPSELCVFVNDFAEDRMSDLVTNIIRRQLYKFTVQQCEKLGVELAKEICGIGYYWDADSERWQALFGSPLYVNGKKILLVPKIIVRKKFIVSAAQYLQKHVLTQRQSYHLAKVTEWCHKKYNKSKGYYYAPPTKKELYEKEVKGHDHKTFIRDFAMDNPKMAGFFRKRQVSEKDIWKYVLSDHELDYYVYSIKRSIA